MGDVLEHIADRGKLTFAACAVHAVIDGNEMNAKLRENNIGIHSHLEIIAPEAAHVLYNDTLDPPSLDVGKHTLEARTVEVCAGITIVLVIMAVGGNPVILAVAFQNLLLRWNLSRGFSAKHNVSENSVQNICRAVSPQRMRIIGSMVFFYL